MKHTIKQIIPFFVTVALLVGLTGCGVVNSGTTEYNELVALVQGVQAAASNFQLITDTQYAKIQTKTQITKDYYDAVNTSGEVWTGNFRSQADALTNMLNNYRDENGQPLDPTKLNLNTLKDKGALPDGLGQGFTLYVNAITQAPPPVPDATVTLALGDTVDEAMNTIQLGGTDWNDAVKAYNTRRAQIKGEVVARVSAYFGFDSPETFPYYQGGNAGRANPESAGNAKTVSDTLFIKFDSPPSGLDEHSPAASISALTGESESVAKESIQLEAGDIVLGDRKNMIFMGTSIASGTGQAVVVGTAMKTELGRIAGLIEEASAELDTPLQQKLDSFGRILVWVTLGIVVLLFVLGLLRGTDPLELFMTSVSLAVAAVPEGLPAVVTVALALGVRRMSRHRALVRKLPAVKTLGSTSVICTDKTGTLTVGEMTARALYVAGQRYEVTGEGYGPDGEVRFEDKKAEAPHLAPLLELATIILACNNANLVQEEGRWKVVGDPTEGALLAAGLKAGGNREGIEKELPKHHEIPFDSDRKLSTVIRKMSNGKLRAFINGAPDVLLKRCTNFYAGNEVHSITDEDRQNVLAQNTAMAKQALRVLGSAYRDLEDASPTDLTAEVVEKDLVFVGLAGMYDPPRQQAKDAVEKCRAAGIQVVMITGDHPDTATAIAREIGIASAEDKSITGIELDKISDDDLRKRVPTITVYARVTAEHKLRIIRAWKANGAVVAMTGDGVNDAPAIKGADIGIVMGKTGTEVTKQAADMIITDDNFATIVAAVEEGRGIYDNIRKTLQYLLAGNTGELLLMTACVIIGLPTPLLPIHLLWINLVTDGLPALCLATDPIDPDVMKRNPRRQSERITSRGFLRTMAFTGFLTAGVAFGVYYYMLQEGTTETARSYAFAVLVFAELLRSFGARSETKPVWRISLFTNINLVIVVAISFGLQVWSQHNDTLGRFLRTSTISFTDGLLLLALGAIPLLVLEVVKVIRNGWTVKQSTNQEVKS